MMFLMRHAISTRPTRSESFPTVVSGSDFICEDAWTESSLWSRRSLYDMNPVAELASQGATLLINISASPFVGKERLRYELIQRHATRHRLPLAMATELMYPVEEEIATLHDALVLGVRDYALKCGFKRAAVALSGGIDSALTFYLAVRALGSEKGQRSCLA